MHGIGDWLGLWHRQLQVLHFLARLRVLSHQVEMAFADLLPDRVVDMDFARLPVGHLSLALLDLVVVLTVQYLAKLRVQEVELVRHRATALGNLHRLANAEPATLPSSE